MADPDTRVREPELADVEMPEPQSGGEIARAADVRPHEPGGGDGVALAREHVIVRHSEPCDKLFKAMADAQAEEGYGDIEKSKTARVKSRKGEDSSYTYTYETLRDVIRATQPYLAKHGLGVMQFPFPGARSVTIRTMVTHTSGQWIYNDLSAMIPMPDPQAVGGGITYLRRYAQKSILNVAAEDEDDDGAYASGRRPDDADQRREPPRAAPRRSQQQPRKAEDAAPANNDAPRSGPAGVARKTHRGKIVELRDRADGKLVKLSDGLIAGTHDAILGDALKRHKAADAEVVLTVEPAASEGYAAKIVGVAKAE